MDLARMFVLAVVFFALISVIVGGGLIWFARRARRAGYGSLRAYLAGVPQSDEQRRDAVDLALLGIVLCVLGLALPPLLLVGIFPLFFGLRKVLSAALGLGLLNDADPYEG